MISFSIKQAIAIEARNASPNECCGFIIDGKIMPCKNASQLPKDYFTIGAKDYAKASKRGEIEAIYHSHINGTRGFSRPDIASCKQSNLPWVLFHLPSGDFFYADPTGNAPYEGRQWSYGIHDCYAIVKDFYDREFGIVLEDFERGEELEWENKGWAMFANNYEDQGFYEVAKPEKKGDILLMQIGAPSPNHVGVMTGDGNSFYHHLMDRLSEKSVYGGYWAKVTTKTLRHHEA